MGAGPEEFYVSDVSMRSSQRPSLTQGCLLQPSPRAPWAPCGLRRAADPGPHSSDLAGRVAAAGSCYSQVAGPDTGNHGEPALPARTGDLRPGWTHKTTYSFSWGHLFLCFLFPQLERRTNNASGLGGGSMTFQVL